MSASTRTGVENVTPPKAITPSSRDRRGAECCRYVGVARTPVRAFARPALMRMPPASHYVDGDTSEITRRRPSDAPAVSTRAPSPLAGRRAGLSNCRFGASAAQAGTAIPHGVPKVLTNPILAGWLRKNGVPYSETPSSRSTTIDRPPNGDHVHGDDHRRGPQSDHPFVTIAPFMKERTSKWSPSPSGRRELGGDRKVRPQCQGTWPVSCAIGARGPL